MKIMLLNEENILENEKQICKYMTDNYKINLNYSLREEELKKLINDIIYYIKNNSAYILGVFEEKKLLGFLWSYEHNYFNEKRLHINHIIIGEEYRNKGIGSILINKIEELAIEKGILKIDLLATKSNEYVVKFYEKHGYFTERLKMCKQVKGV